MRRRKGQAVVEFALVFPFFLLIVIGGIIDFGFAFYNHITLQQIANNTAKFAAENPSETIKIFEYANKQKPKWWEGKFTVYPIQPINLHSGGTLYKAAVSYESQAYTPFYKAMFKVTNGVEYLRLSAAAAYKTPQYLKSDK